MTEGDLDLAVIVPCHNEAATLAQQLDALTAQVWDGRWEIVVVDNNSTDETAKIAQRYAGSGNAPGRGAVRGISATAKSGVAYARNAGVRASSATAVAFCDGDDVVQPGWVTAMGSALASSPLVAGTIDVEQLNPAWLAKSRPTNSLGRLPQFGNVPFARGNNCGMHRELWAELRGFDEEFVGLEDIEFSLRAAAAGYPAQLVSDAVVAYRYRPSLRATFRQGMFYGRGRPALTRKAKALGLPGPQGQLGLKSWAYLLTMLPKLRSRGDRAHWVWVLGNRLGVIRGLTARDVRP